MTDRIFAWQYPPTPEDLEKIRLAREEFDTRWAERQRAARKPKPRTFWQKASEACGMLVVYAIFFLLLVKLVGWLL